MKITNNKISIARGETPTYSASAIDKDTGAPFIITKGMLANRGKVDESDVTFILEFVVKNSIYASKNDNALRYKLILGKDVSYHIFDDDKLVQFTGDVPEWDSENERYKWENVSQGPLAGNENRLHYYTDSDNTRFYIYYNNGKWAEYEFAFNVTFQYAHTSKLETKTYLYEVTLYAGVLKEFEELTPEERENLEYPITILKPFYKKLLAGPYEFKVEGSISE